MKNQKRIKRNVRSEAAMREAIKHRQRLFWTKNEYHSKTVAVEASDGVRVVAIFDLRDCYRKRKPLTGITKKFRKAIQPKRSRK